MSVSPVLQALRAATADQHRRLEEGARVESRLRDPLGRREVLSRLHQLHAAVERVVAPWAAPMAAAGYAPWSRSPGIAAGLRAMGASPPAPRDAPPAASLGEAIGWTYVADGSALGGRVMRRAMIADGVDLTGLDFLDPHGDETGPRWRAFLSAMDRACATGLARPADVVRGGRDAFSLAADLLGETAPAECA